MSEIPVKDIFAYKLEEFSLKGPFLSEFPHFPAFSPHSENPLRQTLRSMFSFVFIQIQN